MSDERNSITVVKTEEASDQAERDRRAELSRQALEPFTQQGNTYRYKSLPDEVLFIDHGDRITSEIDNIDIAVAMAKLAESKGWIYMKAKGSVAFYDAVEEHLPEAHNKREPSAKQDAAETALDNSVAQEKIDTDADDAEQVRRLSLMQSVNDQYRVAGAKYYFKDQAGNVNQLAFKDNGAKLSTALNTERVTRSLVELADAKGWTDIKVTGHKEFKRQIWRAATERGIEVRGYTPDAKDLATVSQKVLTNAIELNTTPIRQSQPTQKSEASRDVSGKLIDHGPMPYQNNPTNKQSYFVTINTGDQERTVWGVGLHEAMNLSASLPGDQIHLHYEGNKPVEVTDNNGQRVTSVRNSWTVTLDDNREVIAAVSSAVAAQHIKNPSDRQRIADDLQARMDAYNGPLPAVQMYDNNATQSVDLEPTKDRTKAPELIR